MKSTIAKVLAVVFGLIFLGTAGVAAMLVQFSAALPQMIKVEDYKPLLVSEVYARDGEKIDEFYREHRTVLPYQKIPKQLVEAFLAAEDDTFFQHGGINYVAIMRAALVNFTSGEKRQGASTITQQVARSLILLNKEKTYTRKIKEILLSYKMEENLSKEEILYLYLNQIYFGAGANGVASAADTYFRKTVDQLTLPEMAILAGLPQAPSNYSPTANPAKAKARQRYVLQRMAAVGFISKEEAEKAVATPVTVYLGKEYKQVAPYFTETLRQLLVQKLGEKAVLDEGLRIYSSIDYKAQQAATEEVQEGLRTLDKRQGYRGAIRKLADAKDLEEFLLSTRKKLRHEKSPTRVIKPDGNVEPEEPLQIFQKKDEQGRVLTNVPDYVEKGKIIEAAVTKVDDTTGLVTVRFAEGQGLLDVADMTWARKPDPTMPADRAPRVTKPSQVVSAGEVILIKVTGDKFSSARLDKEVADSKKKKGAKALSVPNFDDFAQVQLEQQPAVEGSLISFDQKTGDVIAMVGGYEFVRNKNEFNRTIQAKRQTGSSFKTIVYAAALDKGFSPATPIQDAPIVYETEVEEGQDATQDPKIWKPHNHGQRFMGDILFRKALIKSLNIPTVKILESVGVSWVIDYARRLGVFSPVNADLSLGLGSSSLTLYEMTKVFSHFGRLGKKIKPLVIHKVLDKDGNVLLENVSLDVRFEKEINSIESKFEEARKAVLASGSASGVTPVSLQDGANAAGDGPKIPKKPVIYFEDEDQLIRPETAYVMTTLLSGVIHEEGGTAARARSLGRPSAGKTGSTNNYYDAWFVGYTAQVATGVWVGFDEEKSLGSGEVGGRAALPIWVNYMKSVHEDLPVQEFSVPPGVVFANIDNQTGKLASASSSSVVRQAFIEGTEPNQLSGSPSSDDQTEFLKEDLVQ